ncbi:MAG: Conserved hypothetical membrane protein [Parcubacteria group bacterium GW2011_GWF2_39_8b]|nr:MAG: Conserved hypothetical membrane protein [Parcubacteria group bacterium GW2011_GWF2_39_8b]KKR46215.1 MAG: Conserved hypothetical membrane protein [Parcubacteria group bacterium GW2011_GWA2_40_14]
MQVVVSDILIQDINDQKEFFCYTYLSMFIWNLLVKNFPEYCESVAGFWTVEPLNALTNFAFFIGAYYLLKYIRVNNLKNRLSIFLTGLMVVMGLGSLLWHSYRSEITMLLDTLPIYIFFILALYLFVQVLTKNKKLTIVILALLGLIYYLIFTYIPGLNIFSGSLKYIFILIVLVALSFFIRKKYGYDYNFLTPLGIFLVAIMLRTIDIFMCPFFPFGTHFIWHILIAIAMYFGSTLILRLNAKMNQV